MYNIFIDSDGIRTWMSESLLYKLVANTKYTAGTGDGRRSNHRIMFIQEPVGYMYFTHSNIERILIGIRSANPNITYSDIQDCMLGIFYRHGSSYVKYVDHNNRSLINKHVNALNAMTVVEVNRRIGSVGSTHTQYQMILDHPNRLGELPKRTSRWSKTSKDPYYGKDVNDADLGGSIVPSYEKSE